MLSNKQIILARENKELSILDSNSFFGRLDLLINQLEEIDMNDLRESTQAEIEELSAVLKDDTE